MADIFELTSPLAIWQRRSDGIVMKDVLELAEDSRDSCGVSKSAPSLVGGDGNVNESSESSTSNSIFGMVDCSRSLI